MNLENRIQQMNTLSEKLRTHLSSGVELFNTMDMNTDRDLFAKKLSSVSEMLRGVDKIISILIEASMLSGINDQRVISLLHQVDTMADALVGKATEHLN